LLEKVQLKREKSNLVTTASNLPKKKKKKKKKSIIFELSTLGEEYLWTLE
jgi:hypothetical protein